MDAIEILKDYNPLIYLIVTGLVACLGVLSMTVRVLWVENRILTKNKDDLQESKLKIALQSTETIKEAIILVESINKNVLKLADDSLERRLNNQEITQHLSKILEDIKSMKDEIMREISK